MRDVLGAAVAALLAFAAVPAVLVLVVGDPLSGGLGHAWPPASRDALCVLTLAAWVAWAACCAQLLRAVVLHVRRGVVSPGAGASALDRVAARIAIGVLALSSVGAPIAVVTSSAGAVEPAVVTSTTSGPGASAPASSSGPAATSGPAARGQVSLTPSFAPLHRVEHGESLWEIAQAHLGDGGDWPSVAALNLGRDMGDGTRFVDPDHLRTGWRLRLADRPEAAPRPAPDDVVSSQTRRTPSRRDDPTHDRLPPHLPEIVALGMGSLTCAVLARRTRRRRLATRFSGAPPSLLSERAVDMASQLSRFDGLPVLDAFETANVLLGAELATRHGPVPSVRAVCVGPTGVAFSLGEPGFDPPAGFTASDDGTTWHVDYDHLAAAARPAELTPMVTLALPVGDDDQGTWLVALEAGDVLPLLGESAVLLWNGTRAALEGWSWSDRVAVVTDPADPRLPEHGRRGAGSSAVLFFGDPSLLAPDVARSVAVVTTVPCAATALSVLVDRRGATLHPLGRVLRPHLQSSETARAVDELLAEPETTVVPGLLLDAATALPESSGLAARPTRMLRPADVARPLDLVDAASLEALSPGQVEVRLLTAVPRLDGLCEELPANRVRRAVELVAYLALHRPDVVTGDRLRTRVLGSSDADAAAKTLFNIAHAARRAMGSDDAGELLFPSGSRTGTYTVAPAVTVDAQRAVSLVEEGRRFVDVQPALTIAYFRAALELVEGEPLATVLSGYGWWEAEGHAGRVAAALVDAACGLAALAHDAEDVSLARWGIERARLVEPYSEALSRAAMQTAAADGDADRLRGEWRDCLRRADELDPGSTPSPRTEDLYTRLRDDMAGAGIGADRRGVPVSVD